MLYHHVPKLKSGWWFGTWILFSPIGTGWWSNLSDIFFRGVQGGAPKIAKLVYNSNFTRTYGRYIELVAMGLSTNVHITWQLGGHHLVGIPPTRNATHWVLLSLIWETPEREKTLQFWHPGCDRLGSRVAQGGFPMGFPAGHGLGLVCWSALKRTNDG